MFAQAGAKNWLRIFALGLIWGSSFMIIEVAITGFSALWVAAIRITVAALALSFASYATGHGLPKRTGPDARKIWLAAIGMGLFANVVPFSLLSWGQAHVTSSFAGVCMAAVPLIVLPMAHFFVVNDRLTPRKAAGFSIGFIGVFLLVGLDVLNATGSDLETLGRFACLAAAFSYASAGIITRRAPPVSHQSFSAAALTTASCVSLGLALWFDGIPRDIEWAPALATLYLGLFPTALATLLLVTVIREAGPSFLGLSNYQGPVWSVLFGALLLGEKMPQMLVPALALILIGVAVSQRWRA
jgi:drug/metabolite transporter (DMT)-like permease